MHPSLASTLWKALGTQQVGRPLPTLAMECHLGVSCFPQQKAPLRLVLMSRSGLKSGVGWGWSACQDGKWGASKHLFLLR